ncbi:tRNA pseudouridine(55) synthase TruB [Pseudothauera nasutitermitis]|uniref:tRNA pseudouridine synthase B n=1 Tax=Pseudothauera nasutitermitis TaxID=2565930 RepID=A0A4S4B393_9RHOO|nr:tRNA pseudouridine(55) synthase TruB [Pseudothauera nasutitermitis]THF67130.1 tRNA pseudouridine(55) synthase TruB [Pseudothauera nasutitermitis]
MQFRHKRRPIDGVLLLDKPQGLSSNHALQKARRLLNAAKAGHTGTLDPMATGLLPLAFGEATKFSQMLLDADKGYEADVRLGAETDTGDAEGEVIASAPATVDEAAVLAALDGFRGTIQQIPPMFSALKRDGRPLYEYARAGVEVAREARTIHIHELEALGFDGATLRIRVLCSKGTYIRTLAVDLGRVLGCGAHLSALRRTRIGPFTASDAVSMETLEAAAEGAACDALLAPADALVAHLPAIELDPASAALLLQGRQLPLPGTSAGLLRLYAGGRFLGLGETDGAGRLLPKRLVATGEGAPGA